MRWSGPARPPLLVALLAALLLASGCGSLLPGRAVVARVPADDLALIRLFLARYNAAGQEGVRPQLDFLRATQEPSAALPPSRCFGEVTLETRMVERTLRPIPGDPPPADRPGARPPDGARYAAAVAVTALLDGIPVREDVGTKQFVIRDANVFSYAPCPS